MEVSSSSDCSSGHASSPSDDLEPQQHLPGLLPANNHHHHNQDHVQRPSTWTTADPARLNNSRRITTTSLPIFNNCYTFVLLTCLFFLIVSSSASTGTESFKMTRHFDRGSRSVQVIEGNKLHIFCNSTVPTGVKITWFKDDDPNNPIPLKLDQATQQEEKIMIHDEDGINKNSWFEYTEAQPKHRGYYKCVGQYGTFNSSHRFYVRVKDKLMPLWPFLGICGEVTILCLIIIIYEKRRNKAELEESDTDGSPDQ